MKNCKFCGKELEEKSKLKLYCSRSCQGKQHGLDNVVNKKYPFECKWCGKIKHSKRKHPNGKVPEYCSRKCSNEHTNKIRREKKVYTSDGYVTVYSPKHPKQYGGRVKEHVLVAEEMEGRYLEPGECVHHKNHIRDDNRPENLFVCKDNSEHKRIERETYKIILKLMKETGFHYRITEVLNEKYFNGENK